MGVSCSACERNQKILQTESSIDKDAKSRVAIANGVAIKIDIDPAISSITESSISWINSETDDDESSSLQKQLEINKKTKIAITASYLISKTIFAHFISKDNKCEFMEEQEMETMIECILSNIYLQGAATRNILLNESINDLHFLCNTQKLNEIHLKHLKKYHGERDKSKQNRMCKCALWQIYLHKFEKESKLYHQKMFHQLKNSNNDQSKEDLMNSPKYINDCDYILNAKYLVHILTNSRIFRNRLSCKVIQRPSTLIFALQIVGQLMYNNLNLDEQDFDFSDIPPIDTNLEISTHERRQIQLYHQKTRMELIENVTTKTNMRYFMKSSLHSKKQENINNINNNNNNITSLKMLINTTNRVDINLPICNVKMEQHYDDKIDFSINSMVLSLFSIKDIIDIDDDGNVTADTYGDLRSKLECKCNVFDVIKDVEQKVLSTTYGAILYFADTIYRHFWRTIQFGIKYYDKGWRIDPKLIKWHNDLYEEWICNDEWLKSYKNQRIMITQQFNYGYANNYDEYQKMMKLFHDLGYHNKLKSALRTNRDFKKKWIDGLLQKDQEIIDIFKKYGYPTIVVYISCNR